LAYVLNGSPYQIGVGYDATTGSIKITTNTPYTIEGNEMAPPGVGAKTAHLFRSPVLIDGRATDLAAYAIDDRSYFQLRALAGILGFGLDYDEATRTVMITTNTNP
jgi:hypothetical protein